MAFNTKALISFSIVVMILGAGFLWYGINSVNPIEPTPRSSGLLVTKVIDGDTILVEGDRTVRFLGIDTPETKDPRRPVGCFGKEASNETKKLLEGKKVILEKDISETDKYGRLLRYIYLPLADGTNLFVNDYLVREGFATALTYPPDVKYNDTFREAERVAREGNKGLWGRC